RPEPPVGEVVDQKGDGISECAPGENLAEAEMLERELDEEIGGCDDDDHRRDERRKRGGTVHFFILGDGTSPAGRRPAAKIRRAVRPLPARRASWRSASSEAARAARASRSPPASEMRPVRRGAPRCAGRSRRYGAARSGPALPTSA